MVNYYDLLFIGFLYELLIIIITVVLLMMIYNKYLIKRHQFTLILFIIFLNWLIALIFSWFSKFLVLYSGIDYLVDNTLPDPKTPSSFLLLRIFEFRFSFVFVSIGVLFSYNLKVKIFNRRYNPTHKKLVYGYGSFTIIYSFLIFERGILILDVFAFFFVSLFMIIIYIPFMKNATVAYQTVVDPSFKKGFLSLALMSLFLILVFVFFLFDRIMILLGDPGFTIFYFFAWSNAIFAILCALLGYIKPKSK